MEALDKGQKEIYTYEAPWCVYGMAWCRSEEGRRQFRMAISSFKEEYSNEVKIIQLLNNSHDKESNDVPSFECKTCFDHPYPPTKMMFAPYSLNHSLSHQNTTQDLLITSGDYLRIWALNDEVRSGVEMKGLLNNNKHAEYCAPVTSFDWNEADPTMIGSCSIDTTCTIWDVEKQAVKTQLIAHDKEVYDISFANGKDTNLFSTVGADGSLRLFDLRSLEHSTILYEAKGGGPSHSNHTNTGGIGLMRLAWNKVDQHYIATITTDGSKTIIIDIRMPSIAMAELGGHRKEINSMAWAPHSPCHIATVSEDHQALIWDITMRNQIEDPVLAYTADGPINQMQWCSSHEDYIGIAFDDKVQFLKV